MYTRFLHSVATSFTNKHLLSKLSIEFLLFVSFIWISLFVYISRYCVNPYMKLEQRSIKTPQQCVIQRTGLFVNIFCCFVFPYSRINFHRNFSIKQSGSKKGFLYFCYVE